MQIWTRWQAFQWMLDHPWSFLVSAGLVIIVLVGAKLTKGN